MKQFLLIISCICLVSCNSKTPAPKPSTEPIQSTTEQEQLYKLLTKAFSLNKGAINLDDSLAFLILPLQASCPNCRKKTIDSIMTNQLDLPQNHYITIALDAGRKSANSYFREQDYEMPPLTHFFQFDSTNRTYKSGLYKDQPMIYYAVKEKVYKKVAARPSTVREDLREFFSGYRKDKN